MTKLIIGSNSRKLGERLSEFLNLDCIEAYINYFADGELRVQLAESLSGEDVIIVQSTSRPVNDTLMELLLLVDAAKRAGAGRVITLVPYLGYSRQNKSKHLNEPVSAQLVAKFLEAAGVDQLITVDLHSLTIEDFFNIEVQNIETNSLFADALKNKSNLMIVSPDAGGTERAQKLSQVLGTPFVVMNKIRNFDSTCSMGSISENVGGYNCILVDDIVDTGNTLCGAAELLMQHGALSVEAFVTHGVLSGLAVERIEKSALERITITETIGQKVLPSKFKVLDVVFLLGNRMKIHLEKNKK